MSWNWQDIAAMLIVGVAVIYVAARVYQRLCRRESGACGEGCFGCDQTESEPTQLVKLDTSVHRTALPNKPK